jgi:predicted AlkP superfamily phosphohydrolase/phosphomutase
MPGEAPVLAIVLDAGEPDLIEQWTEDGTLPNLRALRASGAYGRLQSTSDWLAGSPWPTFYNGTFPTEHGLYHFLQWRPGEMRLVRPGPDWLPQRPFWRELADRRAIIVDVPMTLTPEPFEGIEISGWATHDHLMPPSTHPRSLMAWIDETFGPPLLREEQYGLQPLASVLDLREELTQSTRQVVRLARSLMRRESWDLAIVAFGASHRGGHKLWDDSGLLGKAMPADRQAIRSALRDVYVACDLAVGELLAEVDHRVVKMVFSLHGMGPNTSRAEIMPELLNRVLAPRQRGEDERQRSDYLQRLRSFVPLNLRSYVKERLPKGWQERLGVFWKMRGIDWCTTPAVSLMADLQGYVRVNLRGREAAGLVEPGDEFESLCVRIAEGLRTFVDADSHRPLTSQVLQSRQILPDGPRIELLPDLLVRWASYPASSHTTITSPLYGSIDWPTPGRNPDGRSGNHRDQGFLIASGGPFKRNTRIESAHILDLAPTMFGLLGVSAPDRMLGRDLRDREAALKNCVDAG